MHLTPKSAFEFLKNLKVQHPQSHKIELTTIDIILDKKLYEKFSPIFAAQIFQNLQTDFINNLFAEIFLLEGLSNGKSKTKKPEKFSGKILGGYWKKHFELDAVTSYKKNIEAHFDFSEKYGKNGNQKLETLVKKALDCHSADEFASVLANGIAINSIEERAKNNKLTGEWIVFDEDDKARRYLTLASHEEKDEEIYKRICDSITIWSKR